MQHPGQKYRAVSHAELQRPLIFGHAASWLEIQSCQACRIPETSQIRACSILARNTELLGMQNSRELSYSGMQHTGQKYRAARHAEFQRPLILGHAASWLEIQSCMPDFRRDKQLNLSSLKCLRKENVSSFCRKLQFSNIFIFPTSWWCIIL